MEAIKGHYEDYGGDGFGGLKEHGDYHVKHGEIHEVQFNSLEKARAYYDNITGEDKGFWAGIELIDCQNWVENKEK